MIDSQTAVQLGLFTALEAAAGVTALADVWQNAPEDTQPVGKGLVIIGLVALAASDDKDGGFDQATIDIYTYVRKPDATQLYALNGAVRNALEGQIIAAPGAEISGVVLLSADPQMMEDGETYFDRLRFEMWVQAA